MSEPIWTDDRKAKARAACEAWRGTPFKNSIRLQGVGVDCINFVAAILIAAEIIPEFEMPFYKSSIGGKGADEIMSEILESVLHVDRIDADQPSEFGDVIIFDAILCCNHVGIMIDGKVWHSCANRQVEPGEMQDYQKHFARFLRVNTDGLKVPPATLIIHP